MKRDAMSVAEYVVDKCYTDGKPISNLGLNKILWYLQIEHFRKFKEFLFRDDFHAAVFGPIIPAVYKRFCGGGAYDLCLKFPERREMWSAEEKDLADSVIEKRRNQPAWALITDVKGYGKAWAEVFHHHEFGNGIIPKNLIVECLPIVPPSKWEMETNLHIKKTGTKEPLIKAHSTGRLSVEAEVEI